MAGAVGVVEIGQLLGVSRQRALVLTKRAGFPAPVAQLAMGRVWDRDQVITWAKTVGRTVREA